jgi:hypothetical protein
MKILVRPPYPNESPPWESLYVDLVKDPRISHAQRDAIRAAVNADVEAEIIGLDGKLRPVLSVRLGKPRRWRRYALLRNGEPTVVTKPMREEWR